MFWDGTPREEAEWWTMKKGQRRAVCRMFTHVFGHELRLEGSRELVESAVSGPVDIRRAGDVHGAIVRG